MMMDMGHKMEMTKAQPMNPEKNKVSYPFFYCDKELPITEKDIGKEMMAMCKIRVTSIEDRKDETGNKQTSRIEIMGMNINPKKTSHYKM